MELIGMARSRDSNEVFRALFLFLYLLTGSAWLSFFLLLTSFSPATHSISPRGKEDRHEAHDPKKKATLSPRVHEFGLTAAFWPCVGHMLTPETRTQQTIKQQTMTHRPSPVDVSCFGPVHGLIINGPAIFKWLGGKSKRG